MERPLIKIHISEDITMYKIMKYMPEGNVRFFGRTIFDKSSNATFFNWSGSGFVFRFCGTKAECFLSGGLKNEDIPQKETRGYIGVYLDDIPYCIARFPIDKVEGLYTLAENLPFGEHVIYVVKETEVANGRTALQYLVLDGEILSPPEEAKIKIEFIGDSITCGYGNICSNASPEFVTAEENFSQTYAAVAARLLNAEVSVIAASGNGFFHDYGCNTHNLIPELYYYTDKFFDGHRGCEPQKWDFEKDHRDIVVVKLGQNDFQYCGGADLPTEQRTEYVLNARREEFCNVATAFLKEISRLRPDTPIIMIYESDMRLKNEIITAVNRADCGIYTMEIMPKREYEGVGANGHFSVYTHTRVGMLLAERIKEIIC